MRNHRDRLRLILAALGFALLALVIASALEAPTAVLTGIIGLLLPLSLALIDANNVENRRRKPGAKAIEDDVD